MSNFPPLPKQNNHKEATFGLKFRRYTEKNPTISSAYELKQVSGDSVAFSAVTESQIAWLLKIKHKGALIRVIGTTGEPDYVWVHGPAHVVVKFKSCFCIIDIDTWLKEKEHLKSLKSERAQEIAKLTVNLN